MRSQFRIYEKSVNFLMIFTLLTALHGAVLFFLYQIQYNRNLDLLVESQENMIRMEEQKISTEILNTLEQLSYLELAVEHEVMSGRLPEPDRYTPFFRLIGESSGQFSVMRLLSPQGMEIFRMNFDEKGKGVLVPPDELQDKQERYYIHELREAEESIYISPLDLDNENKERDEPYNPVIRFGRSILDKEGHTLAYLVLNYRAENILNGLGRHELLTDECFSTYLLNNEGFWLKGPDSSREFGFMHKGLEDETLADTNPDLWVQLQVDEKGHLFQNGNLYVHRTLILKKLIKPEWGRYISRNHQGDRSFYLIYFTSRDVLRKMSIHIIRSLYFPFLITQLLIILIAVAGAWVYSVYRKNKVSLQFLTCLDELTDCLNSGAGRKILEKTRSLVYRRNSVLTVVSLDLKGLNRVYDFHGFPEGDRYLLTMVEIVQQQLRNSDFLIRLDEGDFLMILPDCSEDQATIICDRLQEKVEKMNVSGIYPYDLGLNLGILEAHREKHQRVDQLIEEARMIMDRSKQSPAGERL